MCIAGYITDFSFSEIVQLVEQGKKTDLLRLRAFGSALAATLGELSPVIT